MVLRALSGRTNLFHVDIGLSHLIRIEHRPACFQVDFACPVCRRVELVRSEKLAIAPVHHIGKSVAVEMGECRYGLAIDDADVGNLCELNGNALRIGHGQPLDRLRRRDVFAAEFGDDVEPPLSFI